jgi:hypothetical protein
MEWLLVVPTAIITTTTTFLHLVSQKGRRNQCH